MELQEGILLIDKPSGMTSFDVIRKLRRRFLDARRSDLDEIQGAAETSERDVCDNTMSEESRDATQEVAKSRLRAPKMGHAGTLDPLATGLMVLGVGKGTKELANLVKLDKEYIAEILIGESRTTGDMEGGIVEEREVVESFSEEKLSTTLSSMCGTLTLPVSAYSAIKVDGTPMYKRARAAAARGETVEEVPVRDMVVYEAELLKTNFIISNDNKRQVVQVRFSVGSGTYIRSLAEELGSRLGYPATLYSLRRTKVGEFDIKDAHQLDEF